MPDLRIVKPNSKYITRRVQKFGMMVAADNQTEEDVEKHFKRFLQSLDKKGWHPIKQPSLENNYYFQEKGSFNTYEDINGNIKYRFLDTDEHYFHARCVYIKNLSKEIKEIVINHYKERT